MSLQIVLIAIGIILIIAIYVISILPGRGKLKSAKSGQPGQLGSNRRSIDDNGAPNNLDLDGADLDGVDSQADDIPVLDDQVSDSLPSRDELEQDPVGTHRHSESRQIKSGHDTHQQAMEKQQIENQVRDDAEDIAEDEILENVPESERTRPDAREPLEDIIEPQSNSYSDGIYSIQIPKRSCDSGLADRSLLKDSTDNSAELDNSLDLKGEPQLDQGSQPETEQAFADAVKSGSSSKYSYPDIDGFEKVSQIDYWVRLPGERDVGRESVLAQYREAKSALTKHSRILGLKIPKKNWCDLEKESEDARFGDIIVTIQLADQKGPISETELAKFSELVVNLSAGIGRSFAFMAPLESALQQANAISDFVRYYESVFVVNVKQQHTDYLDGGAINWCATQLGLERSENNYFVRNKTIGKAKVCLYSLANMSDSGEFDFDNLRDFATREVIFFTKPAVNRSPGAVFSEMVDTAKAFAGRIKGHAVAPNHEDLSQQDIEQIRLSIEKVARDMERQGMEPGSDEAIRIF